MGVVLLRRSRSDSELMHLHTNRGKIDQSGVVSAFLEEKLNVGITFLLSGEIDHVKKDYKFGFGLTVGE